MTILYRNEYINEPNKFDIPIAHKPVGTQHGDFMLMRIITLNDREPIPVVPGWTLVVHDYLLGISQFVFSKIADDTGDKYTVIRKKTGINYIQIYSWYSKENSEIILDEQTILVPSTFKYKRNRKFDISEYTMQYAEYETNQQTIRLINSDYNVITVTLFETDNIYQSKIVPPVITVAQVTETNNVILKWDGVERYTIEMAQDGYKWYVLEENLVDNTYVVNDLLPSTKYHFRVYAVKDNVVSAPSTPIKVKTYDKILLRAATHNNAGTINPHIVVAPTGIQKGDLLIMQVSYMPKMKIMKLSPGWKLLHEYKNTDVCCNIYYKIATRKEPGSYFVQHNGVRGKKMLLAVAAFYSPAGQSVRIANSDIQYNPSSNHITFPPVPLEADYSLGIAMSVRNMESSLRLPIDSTIMWDVDKNLRTTGMFQGYINVDVITPEPIYANPGVSISATIALIEKEIMNVPLPPTPTGLRAKRAEGTVIRLS